MQLPYWTSEFVGAGPYRIREWAPDSHMLLAANDQYFLGRPDIDEIELRFVLDFNVLVASLLAGSIELTQGRGLDPEHVAQIRDKRKDMQILLTTWSWLPIIPQLLNPDPPIM